MPVCFKAYFSHKLKLSWTIYCSKVMLLCVCIQHKEYLSLQWEVFFFLVLGKKTPFFKNSTEFLNSLRRNGARRRFRNLCAATGVTVCGHQPAVILVKLMFCRGAVQRFLLRRTLYPVFHSQWSCVSFPHCNAVWAQSCDHVLWLFSDWREGG